MTSEDAQLPKGMYFLMSFFDKFKAVMLFLNQLETNSLRRQIDKIDIVKPIYITGLARSGTTVTLEMLSNHPDLAYHRYQNMPMPFLPHWFTRIGDQIPIMITPRERIHKDGLIVTKKSADELEEILWMKFFPRLHSELHSHIMSSDVSNPPFEQFYQDHIRKLLYDQNRTRYLTKNNYDVTRTDYLQKIFPDAKFILLIRHPIDHIASTMKQNKLLGGIYDKDQIVERMTQIVGHFEFGRNRLYVNVGNTDQIKEIRRLCSKGQDSKAYALYWKAIYDFIYQKLQTDKKFAQASIVIRHEDYIESPIETIDKIIEHTEIDPVKFEKTRKIYATHFHKPSYYKPEFTDEQTEEILNITKDTANKFGYKL
jgi:hypothetical protein